MKILKEFKEFAVKGNVLDMAIGVVIGGAFGKIVTSLVNDIIMPVATFFIDQKFSTLALELNKTNVVAYGNFIQTIIDFLIIAFCIFLVVKIITAMREKAEKLKKKEEEQTTPPAPAEPGAEEKLLMEIRDLLREKK